MRHQGMAVPGLFHTISILRVQHYFGRKLNYLMFFKYNNDTLSQFIKLTVVLSTFFDFRNFM